MIPCQFSLYLGKEKDTGYTDFIADDQFYFILEVEEGYTKEQGKELINLLKERIKRPIENLYAFELLITDTLKHANVPAHFSVAAFYRKEDMIYLKAAGAGQIFLNREGEFAKIIEGDNSASGYIKAGDFFILTTSRFTHLIGSEKHFKQILSADNLEKNVEELTAQLEGQKNEGIIALFLLCKKQSSHDAITSTETQEKQVEEPDEKKISLFSTIKQKISGLRTNNQNSPLRRILTIAGVVLVTIILLWSVVSGIQKKTNSELNQKIQSSKQIIEHKLTEADGVAPLNLASAIALVDQAKRELQSLKEAVGDREIQEVKELEEKIKVREQTITKKEEKKFDEFFDLTVDNQAALGDLLYLDGEVMVILDKKRGVTYNLSLEQKSLGARSASGLKQATLIGKNEDQIYAYIPSSGIHSIDEESNTKKMIDQDSEWGKIIGLAMYSGNIYLLDSSNNDVYKYSATDSGFGARTSYFKGVPVNLTESNSIAIDSSVYLGFSDGILKFTSGLADTFKTSFPEENVNIRKVFTSEDLDKVYAWDKSKGAIYILSKNGTYEGQIKSEILAKAADIVVYENHVFAVYGSKIYSVTLE